MTVQFARSLLLAFLLSISGAAFSQAPHDDLSLFISKVGQPDQIISSEKVRPRPPIVTKQLIYKKANVRAVYFAEWPVGAPPPHDKWKLMLFQDHRRNVVLSPAEAVTRCRGVSASDPFP